MSLAATRRDFLGAGAALLATLPRMGRGQSAAGDARNTSRLILLGTGGGPTPKPNRSAPAQVIVVNGVSYVIDCGNGVARQMVLAGVPLASIRDVFITHQHSDHNADYGNLLWLSWAATLTARVNAYGPPPLEKMTRLFLEMNDYDIKTRMADEGRPSLKDMIAVHEITEGGAVMQDANVKVTAALVDHPPVKPAFAYRFDCPDRSIVISGDTRPSPNLVRLAQGADVLVHEVMYLPALEQVIGAEPNAKSLREHLLASHTTTEQVGRIATEAGRENPGPVAFRARRRTRHQGRSLVRCRAPFFSGNLIVGRDLLEL